MRTEKLALATMGQPPVTLRAYHDQLKAAVEHARTWTSDHPCPDRRFRRHVKEFIYSCATLRVVMLARLRTEDWDGHRERFEGLLIGRFSQEVDARVEIERRLK